MDFHSSERLLERGVILPHPTSVHVAHDVPLEHLAEGVTLHPGSRIEGSSTVLAAGCRIATEGPARLRDVAVGKGASVASGSLESCALLPGASTGPDAHVRAGCVLEESASIGHGVGIKQTVLTSFATLGSLINACDCLLTGGRSRTDHSEIGSGFIHFNFTPFGSRGDKSTASLFGTIPEGILLDQDRIFIGGAGGVVGPIEIGFGTVLAAGSVYRRDYGEHLLVYAETLPAKTIEFEPMVVRRVPERVQRSVRYIGQLQALVRWYRDVRVPQASDPIDRAVLEHAIRCLDDGISERVKQVDRLLVSAKEGWDRMVMHGKPPAGAEDPTSIVRTWTGVADSMRKTPDCPGTARATVVAALSEGREHVAWVRSLKDEVREAARGWLNAVAAETVARWKG